MKTNSTAGIKKGASKTSLTRESQKRTSGGYPLGNEGSRSSHTGSPSTSTRSRGFASISIDSSDDQRTRILKRLIVLLEAVEVVAIELGEFDPAGVERVMSALYGTVDLCAAELSSPSLTEANAESAGQRTTQHVELTTEGYDQTARCVGCGAFEGSRHLSSCGDHDYRNAVAGVRS